MTRIGIVFPGQGSQRVGMGAGLADASAESAAILATASDLLGYDLAAVLAEGPEERLRATEVSQPAIFVVGYALARLVAARAAASGATIVASAGHSFAEFCALTLAGSLGFEEALRLVIERGDAMRDAAARVPGAMAAVLGLDEAPLREAVGRVAADGGVVSLAAFNSPGQIVISGERAAVERAGEFAKAAGAKKIVPLPVSGAWHSALMRPARDRFAASLAEAAIALPSAAVVSSVDAEPYREVATIRGNLGRSVTDEVLWHRCSERLVAEGLDLLVECGGSAVLAPLAKRLPGAPRALTVTSAAEVDRLEIPA